MPGIGSGTFTDAIVNVVNQNADAGGISDFSQNLVILFIRTPTFANYGLSSSIGPLSGRRDFNPGHAFATTAGDFTLDTITGATFQATVVQAVPEPDAMGMLAGAACFGPVGS